MLGNLPIGVDCHLLVTWNHTLLTKSTRRRSRAVCGTAGAQARQTTGATRSDPASRTSRVRSPCILHRSEQDQQSPGSKTSRAAQLYVEGTETQYPLGGRGRLAELPRSGRRAAPAQGRALRECDRAAGTQQRREVRAEIRRRRAAPSGRGAGVVVTRSLQNKFANWSSFDVTGIRPTSGLTSSPKSDIVAIATSCIKEHGPCRITRNWLAICGGPAIV
jgi:hypothetical protein